MLALVQDLFGIHIMQGVGRSDVDDIDGRLAEHFVDIGVDGGNVELIRQRLGVFPLAGVHGAALDSLVGRYGT